VSRLRIAAIVLAAVVGAWGITLVVLDSVLASRQANGTTARLGESLHGHSELAGANLALVRGELDLDGLSVHRDDTLGHLALEIGRIRCDLPPLGWALVDGTCRELAIRKTRLDVSAAALLQIEHPRRAPVHARSIVVDDAELQFAPSAFAPSLGVIRIAIDHAEAGDTVLRTPLSWVFALESLNARVELPAGIALRVRYADGVIAVAGGLLGSDPVELSVHLPSAAEAGDAKAELAMLVELGEQIAARVVEKRASDWLRSTLPRASR
jgi:hypothetical protein